MLNRLLFIVSLSLLIPVISSAQKISARKPITICEGYLSPSEALTLIENREGIKFSYNPRSFSIQNEIYLCKRKTPLNEVVSYILGKPCDLIIEGNHIIIKPTKLPEPESKKNSFFRLSGIVENGINGMPLDSAKIEMGGYIFYTNETGYFTFNVNNTPDSLTLFISKENYIGYKRTVTAEENRINIYLYQSEEMDYTYMPSSVKDKNSTIENYWLTNIVVDEDQTSISKNRRVLIDKTMQFSVIPNVGTNNNESGLYRYKRSYNILAGYVGEVYGHEIGLGVNVVRFDMTGIQASGLANVVGGEVAGIQLSGGANVCTGNTRGVQVSGTANSTWGNFKGAQFSSGVNIVRSKMRGFQLAPVNIVGDTLLGMQTGALNISSKPSYGTQLSTILNYSPISNKLQYSTFININKENNAAQLGVLNFTKTQNKFQLGFFNFADTVSGVSIGLFSFVKKGYTHLDYSFNLDKFSNIKFKTGTHKFYNNINIGFRIDEQPDVMIGYGFGSDIHLWKMFSINYDLTCSQVFENNNFNQNLNLYSQLNINLNFAIAKRFIIFAGGQMNMMTTSNLTHDGLDYYSSIPSSSPIFEEQYKKHRTYMWPSFHIGVRI